MRKWVSKRYPADLKKIAERYQITEIVADVLVKRGLFDWEAMDTYLFPDETIMHPPEEMKDFVKAAGILERKIDEGKKIKIIGDYDVDGIMSTYILHRGIQLLGGEAGYCIPHRVEDGYGMRDYMAKEAFSEGYDTILTCDNGISAADAVACAKELGMTVVVTDHHEVPCEGEKECLPDADAIVDPKQKECNYPFKNLCGAGIAYKLMRYLLKKRGINVYEKELLPFAAVATVCDVVPLMDENRYIVKRGLELLKETSQLGLRALLDALQLKERMDSYTLGFRIGPCLNAAGRLSAAQKGMKLFLAATPKEAKERAEELVTLNEERKDYTAKATQRAIQIIEERKMLHDTVLVVYIPDCHESVAGIVAGRIREKYYRPTLIVTDAKTMLKGSARSIPGYHVQKELSKCSYLLEEFGGHALAAGFSLKEENLDSLRETLNQNSALGEEELTEKVYFDCEVPLEEMTHGVVQQLSYMEPFGEGNERAVFARGNVSIVSMRLCGKEMRIAQLKLRDGMQVFDGIDFQAENCLFPAIKERYGEEACERLKNGTGKDYVLDILYRPTINERYGNIQFQIIDCQ